MSQTKQSAIERLSEWKKNYPVEPHSDSENPEDWAMIAGYCYKAYEISLDLAKELDDKSNQLNAYIVESEEGAEIVSELEAELAEAKEAIAKREKLLEDLSSDNYPDGQIYDAWQKLKSDEAKGGFNMEELQKTIINKINCLLAEDTSNIDVIDSLNRLLGTVSNYLLAKD